MSSHPEFARRLREFVEPLNLKQSKLGKLWGCTQSYAGQILRGDAHPGREIVERIIEAHELPRDVWLARAGYGPRSGVDEDEVKAAELALAAAGWTYKPEFGEALDKLRGDRTVDAFAEALGHKPAFIAASLRGWSPADRNILLGWIYSPDLDMTFEQADSLLQAAGLGRWIPSREIQARIAFYERMQSQSPSSVHYGFDDAAEWLTPRLVAGWVRQAARRFDYANANGLTDGYWRIEFPSEPQETVVVEWRARCKEGTWLNLYAGKDILEDWARTLHVVEGLVSLCERSNGPILFDFRKLRDLKSAGEGAELVAETRDTQPGGPIL